MKALYFLVGIALAIPVISTAQNAKPVRNYQFQEKRAERSTGICTPDKYLDQSIEREAPLRQTAFRHNTPNVLPTPAETDAAMQKLNLEEEFDANGEITTAIEQKGYDAEMMAANPTVVSTYAAVEHANISPGDNALAVSNGGYVLTANNQRVYVYSPTGSVLINKTLSDFVGGSTQMVFDPKIIYDSSSDRFIFVCCKGSSPATSKVLILFSKTNNPSGGWWLYQLSGNPYNNSCWFDYPLIGLSSQELYVSGNLFAQNSAGANSFSEAVVFQINKSNGFNGQNLNYQTWHNFPSLSPFNKPFALVPLSWGGSGNYGPGCYFVCHADSPTWGNFTYLYDLTGYLGDPNTTIEWDYFYTGYFEIGTSAYQKGSSEYLLVNDCRILSGFYKDGIIHYVFHAKNSNGWNAVRYHRLNVADGTISEKLVWSTGRDLCFPSVAWAGTTTNDKSVVIAFEHSNSSTYPSSAVVTVDNAMNTSANFVNFAAGTSYINFDNSSTSNRWGDYTAAVRKPNTTSSPRIYVAGGLGSNANSNHKWWHQAAVIGPGAEPLEETSDDRASVPEEQNEVLTASTGSVEVFPNPVKFQECTVKYNLPEKSDVLIQVFDAAGSLVQTLLDDKMPKGGGMLTFNAAWFVPGVYFIAVQAGGHTISTQKLIVAP